LKSFRRIEFKVFLIFPDCAVKGTGLNKTTNPLKVSFCEGKQYCAAKYDNVQSGISHKLQKTGKTSNLAFLVGHCGNSVSTVEITPQNYTENVIQTIELQEAKVLPKDFSDNSIVLLIFNRYSNQNSNKQRKNLNNFKI